MGRVLLVRHGQAAPLTAADYDELSDLGARQARALADGWARWQAHVDVVRVGPRKRHRQTYDACAERTAELAWPLPELGDIAPGLDEHHGQLAFKLGVQALLGEDGELGAAARAVVASYLANRKNPGSVERPPQRQTLRAFREVMVRWADGRLDLAGRADDGFEDWPAFVARVDTQLAALHALADGKRTVAAFTSGGFIGVAVGRALGLDRSACVRLTWSVMNASVTELVATSDGGWVLHGFNGLEHLTSPDLRTFV